MLVNDRYPCLADLTGALGSALSVDQNGALAILDRQPNQYASTFPSEIVRCTKNGQQLAILCKYDTLSGEGTVLSHRSDVSYEAAVYGQLLSSCPLTLPKWFGTHRETTHARAWLFLEYLDGAMYVSEYPDPDGLVKAARWLGEFHRWTERQMDRCPSSLKVYDAPYYLEWARRTVRFDRKRHDWLAPLCERASAALIELLIDHPVVIHGEFYVHNVLMRDGIVYPVDWQSAALAAGEIDFAALTDSWPPEMIQTCASEYCTTRWPTGAPEDFERRVAAARVYWTLRWLGARPDWTADVKCARHFQKLREQGQRLGLI